IFVILGSGAFGPIIAFLGVPGAMMINAATFVISALFVSWIRLDKQVEEQKQREAVEGGGFFTQLKEGLGYFYQKKIIFLICFVGSFISMLFVPESSMITPYVQGSLGLGEYALSTISISTMVGTLFGTAFFPYIGRKLSKVQLFVGGGFACSIAYISYALIPNVASVGLTYILLILAAFTIGIGGALLNVAVNVAFMEQIDSNYLGRVGAIFNAMATALIPVASFAVAGVASFASVTQIFMVCGIISAILFVVLSMSKTFRQIDNPPGAEEALDANQHSAELSTAQ
ncbi:MFS transporter, partial [Eubacteriales bacterium OttesenSCG-928-N14]|nr:MFS transporter [Eubacteriales bacterium OttesenSCG-928-N14]